MRARSRIAVLVVCSAALLGPESTAALSGPPVAAQSPTFGVGHTATADELKSVDIDITPDGKGLPAGSGSAEAGRSIFASRCAQCHGPTGTEGPQNVLAGGRGSLTSSRPLKTVGSYWPYATTLWDYVNRAMPFDQPGTLTPDQVYSLTAFILNLNGIVGERDVLDRTTLPQVRMPNREGFEPDPRPDVDAPKKTTPHPHS